MAQTEQKELTEKGDQDIRADIAKYSSDTIKALPKPEAPPRVTHEIKDLPPTDGVYRVQVIIRTDKTIQPPISFEMTCDNELLDASILPTKPGGLMMENTGRDFNIYRTTLMTPFATNNPLIVTLSSNYKLALKKFQWNKQ